MSSVRLAALSSVPALSISQISVAILASTAAPMKNVFGLARSAANAVWIRPNAVRAVFQCSSAPAGSIPPFNSPSAR